VWRTLCGLDSGPWSTTVYVKRNHVPATFDLASSPASVSLDREATVPDSRTSRRSPPELRSCPRRRGLHLRDMPQENPQMDRQVFYIQPRLRADRCARCTIARADTAGGEKRVDLRPLPRADIIGQIEDYAAN
jgi:hypothetical protein